MSNDNKIQKILLVDDDPTHIKLLQTRLEEKGYKILATTEASDGLQLAMKDKPDLIILDVMMPIINGYNFCKILKSEKLFKNIPIIMVTGRNEQSDIDIGMEMGADAYLCKPVEMNKLLESIAKIESKKNA